MTDEPILITLSSGHARITLNRPKRLNALTRDMLVEAGRIVTEAANSDSVKVISLTGAGRGFCAGQDLAERDPRTLDGPLDLAAIQRTLFHPIVRTLNETGKPVIACVNGIASGAGMGLALAADIVIAAESAKFALSFAKVGLSVDAGLGRALVMAVGPARGKALLMLGETIPAIDAAAMGLIWRAVPDDKLESVHAEIVDRLLKTPATALGGIKTALAASHRDLDSYLEIEALQQGIAGSHPDYAEGVLAFLERRPPRFA